MAHFRRAENQRSKTSMYSVYESSPQLLSFPELYFATALTKASKCKKKKTNYYIFIKMNRLRGEFRSWPRIRRFDVKSLKRISVSSSLRTLAVHRPRVFSAHVLLRNRGPATCNFIINYYYFNVRTSADKSSSADVKTTVWTRGVCNIGTYTSIHNNIIFVLPRSATFVCA